MTTSTAFAAEPTVPSIEDMLKIMNEPRLVGHMGGIEVWVDPSVPDNQVQFRHGKDVVAFSVDHPYIQGTSLEASVRRALGNDA